ncbi:MAG: hypothetical protein JRE23_10515 [Deltaproteobacteria bacterium]|nr:hypothetical protein [Deltaproteobacteria bacterium]
MAHEEQDKVGQHFMKGKKRVVRDYDWSGLENVVAQAALGEAGVELFACPKRGRRIVAYAPIQAGNQLWSFGISVSYSEIEAPIIQHERNILALSALIMLLFGTAAVAVFRIRNRQ